MKGAAGLLALVVVALFIGAEAALTPDFYWEPSNPTDMEEVHFYDNSTGDVVAWIWYFGDGNSSTERNPSHIYGDNGTYTVRLVVIDGSGASKYVEKNITIENVPPVAVAGDDVISHNLTIELNGSQSYDMDGNIVNYTWDFGDGSVGYGMVVNHTYGEEGIYVVNLSVKDNDGATSMDSLFATIDFTPPVTNYTVVGGKKWYRSNITIIFNASDNISGVNATFYKINDGEWMLYEENITLTEEGLYVIYYYSVDNAGNVENISNFTVGIDFTPPETIYGINASYGLGGWIKGVAKISFEASDAISGVNYTMYKIDDGDWKKYNGTFNFSVNGIHKIYYYSVDNAGNVEDTSNFTIKMDNVNPSVSISSPDKGYIYIFKRRILPSIFGNTVIIGKFEAEAEASDSYSGVFYVEFILNGETLWKAYSSPYTAELPRSRLLSKNTIKVIAYDKVGNSAESEEITYIKIR